MTRWWWSGASAAAALCLLTATATAGASEETTGPAQETVDLGGTAVRSTTDAGNPTELGAGIWSDTLGPGGTAEGTHYFVYRRTMADSTVHVGITGANSVPSDQVEVQVETPEGDDCGSASASSGYSDPFATFGAAVSAGPDAPGERDSACLTADELRIAVGRGSATTTSDLTIALRVVEEAPVLGATDLPPPPETPRVAEPDGTGSGGAPGATALEDAPYLEPGGYEMSVVEGEQRLWRVRLDWGEQLSVQVDVAPHDAAATGALEFAADPGVELALIDPVLAGFSDVVADAESSGSYAEESSVLKDGSPPVGYLNRFDFVPASLPGDYWVSVSVSPATDREALEIPMGLEVDITGDGAGRPTFPDTVLGVGGGAEPDGYDPSTPYLIGDGEFSADVSGTPQAPSDDDEASDGLAGRQVSGIALALLSAVSVVAGLVLLRRRRLR